MLNADEIRGALISGLLEVDPFADESLQPASYDCRVGREAFVSGDDEKLDVANKGLVIVDPGEFAVIATRERVHCGPQIAGQLGLSSYYARQGLVLLSGPQIDPGFDGVLVVRVTNLAPRRVTLAYEAAFLTVQFFKLNAPVANPYQGSRQGQTGLAPKDMESVVSADSPTLGGMVRSLATLAADVGALKTSVRALTWVVGGSLASIAVAALVQAFT